MRFIVIIFLFSIGCSSDTIPDNYDLDGVLLFEEILSNRTWGNFPDLVAFNPRTEERFILTRETLYNVRPSWVAGGDSIIFESKRVQDHGAPSHLYVLNTRNSRITPLQEGMNLDRMSGGHIQYQRPAINNQTNRVYYYGLDCKCILSMSLHDKSVDTVRVNAEAASNIFWSNDYNYLVIQDRIGAGMRRHVVFTVYKFGNYSPELLMNKENWNFHPGDLYKGKLLYTTHKAEASSVVYLKVHDMHTGEKKKIGSYDRSTTELRNYISPVFKDEHSIYYLKETSSNIYEIFEKDIQSGETRQITYDNKLKSNLTIYRPRQN